MSFALLSTLAVLLGIALLAIGLWFAQRLRVQHREVEVMSTLFWHAAVEETRARVLVRRFRHWPAWALLVTIAALLWALLATPQRNSLDGTRHVVLVDWTVQSDEVRSSDLDLAIQHALRMPTTAREIVAAGNQMETLLAPGEPVNLARLRSEADVMVGAPGIGWAIDSLSARATKQNPLAIYLVGSSELDQQRLDSLDDNVSVYRIDRQAAFDQIELKTLGIADAASGRWDAVDVHFAFSGKQPIESAKVSVLLNGTSVDQSATSVDAETFQLADIDADGGVLSVQVDGRELGAVTLPLRQTIRVSLSDDVPESLRQLIALDRACEIAAADADVTIGQGSDCDLCLSGNDQPAFVIGSTEADPAAVLGQLVDELALKQIDATSIAQQSGTVVDVQVQTAPKRQITVWESLFTSSFDFQESRACPIFVSRSVRWLADRPELVPWVSQGQRLPVARRDFDRINGVTALTRDGRELAAARTAQSVANPGDVSLSPGSNPLTLWSLTSWMGLIVAGLLVGEWVLYQRGRMP